MKIIDGQTRITAWRSLERDRFTRLISLVSARRDSGGPGDRVFYGDFLEQIEHVRDEKGLRELELTFETLGNWYG